MRAVAIVLLACALAACGKTTSDSDDGSGNCEALSGVNAGAIEGPLAIEGHVRDAAGRGIVGARVDLDAAVRFTDLNGGYHFRVSPGSYLLRVSAACDYGWNAAVEAIDGDSVTDFVAAGDDCTIAAVRPYGSNALAFELTRNGLALGDTIVSVTDLSSRDEALERLQSFVDQNEEQLAVCELTIAGEPAVEARGVITSAGLQGGGTISWLDLDTMIVVDASTVWFRSQLAVDTPLETQDFLLAAARNVSAAELPELRVTP